MVFRHGQDADLTRNFRRPDMCYPRGAVDPRRYAQWDREGGRLQDLCVLSPLTLIADSGWLQVLGSVSSVCSSEKCKWSNIEQHFGSAGRLAGDDWRLVRS